MWLDLADLFLEGRSNFHDISKTCVNYDQVELRNLFLKFRRQRFHHGIQANRLSVECIGNHIGLPRVVIYSNIIVID